MNIAGTGIAFTGMLIEDVNKVFSKNPKRFFLINSFLAFATYSITSFQAINLANTVFKTASISITFFPSHFIMFGAGMFACGLLAREVKASKIQKILLNAQDYLIKINRLALLISSIALTSWYFPGARVGAAIQFTGLIASSFSGYSVFQWICNYLHDDYKIITTKNFILKQELKIAEAHQKNLKKLSNTQYPTIQNSYFAFIRETTQQAVAMLRIEPWSKFLSQNLDSPEEGLENLNSLLAVQELSRMVQLFEVMDKTHNTLNEVDDTITDPLFSISTGVACERLTKVILLKKLIDLFTPEERELLKISLLTEKQAVSEEYFRNFTTEDFSRKELFSFVFREISILAMQLSQGTHFQERNGTNVFMQAYSDAVAFA